MADKAPAVAAPTVAKAGTTAAPLQQAATGGKLAPGTTDKASKPSTGAAKQQAKKKSAPDSASDDAKRRKSLRNDPKTYRPQDLSPYLPEDFIATIPSDPEFAQRQFKTGSVSVCYEEPSYTGYRNFDFAFRKAPVFHDLPRGLLNPPKAMLDAFAVRTKDVCESLAQANPTRLLRILEEPEFQYLNTTEFEHLEDFRRFFTGAVNERFFHDVDESRSIEIPLLARRMQWRSDRFFAQQMVAGTNPVVLELVRDWKEANKSMRMTDKDIEAVESTLTGGAKLQDLVAANRIYLADYHVLSQVNGGIIHPAAEPPTGRAGGRRAAVHSPAALFWADGQHRLMPLAIQITSGKSLTESQARKLPEAEQDYYFSPADHAGIPHEFHDPDLLVAPPADTEDDAVPMDWLYARLCVMNADSLWHMAVSVVGHTYFVPATIVTAMLHALPPTHGLRRLLDANLEGTLSMNVAARIAFLQDSPANFFSLNSSLSALGVRRLADIGLRDFHLTNELHFPTKMQRRGFGRAVPLTELDDDPAAVSSSGSAGGGAASAAAAAASAAGGKPGQKKSTTAPLVTNEFGGFFYRDDGFAVWDALAKHVKDCLRVIYPTDSDMEKDKQLRFFYEFLTQDDVDGVLGGRLGGVPPLFYKSREQLESFVTILLFTVTAHRSAIAFGMFDFYAFAPSRPLFLAKPFPTTHREVHEGFIIQALPNAFQVLGTVIVAHSLSRPSKALLVDEPSMWQRFKGVLGSGGPFHKEEQALEQKFDAMEDRMVRRNQEMKKREDTRTFPAYKWMLPSSLAASVAF